MTRIEELNNYREDDSLNQSFLKGAVAVNNPKIKKSDSESIACLKGSLCDVLCLTPELQDEFYYFSKLDKYPSPQYKETLDNTFLITQEWDLYLLLEQFRLVSNVKSKDDIIYEKLNACEDYWQDLIDGQGKKVITNDYYSICSNAVYTIKNHEFTKHHFENTLFADIQYQVPVYDEITFNGHQIKRKGLLDLLVIDEAHKTVQIKDLKTTASSPDEWFRQARQFNYPFQMAWYYDIVEKLFPNHRQLLPELIVYSFAAPNKPFTKIISLDDLHIGRHGMNLQKSFVEYDGGIVEPISERIMGWEECLTRYLICQENGWPDWDVNYWTSQAKVTRNIW